MSANGHGESFRSPVGEAVRRAPRIPQPHLAVARSSACHRRRCRPRTGCFSREEGHRQVGTSSHRYHAHLVVSTNMDCRAPSVDVRLVSLLGLRANVCRTMLQFSGCTAGCGALRLAKDLAENNRGARVLEACVEITIAGFSAPDDSLDTLLINALFADGAGAVIVGADAGVHPAERPLFEMVSAAQTIIPNTEHMLTLELGVFGVHGKVSTKITSLVGDNIERCLRDAFAPLAMDVKWNDLFWAVHPGSRVVLDQIDKTLRLEPTKLAASRTIVQKFGNMLSAAVIFILDEQQR